MINSANHDLAALARLNEAGKELGLSPRPGEEPLDFAARIAEALAARRMRFPFGVATRIAITAALAAFGIASF